MWFFYRHYRLPLRRFPHVVRPWGSPGRMPLWYLRHMAEDGPVYIGLRSRTPFDARLRCLKGSDWFTASSRAVAHLVRAWREDHELVRHYRRTLSPVVLLSIRPAPNTPDLPASLDNRRYIVGARRRASEAPAARGPGRHARVGSALSTEVRPRGRLHRSRRARPAPASALGALDPRRPDPSRPPVHSPIGEPGRPPPSAAPLRNRGRPRRCRSCGGPSLVPHYGRRGEVMARTRGQRQRRRPSRGRSRSHPAGARRSGAEKVFPTGWPSYEWTVNESRNSGTAAFALTPRSKLIGASASNTPPVASASSA